MPFGARQAKIDNHQIWLQLTNLGHALGCVTGFTANRKTVGRAVDQLFESFSKKRMIVNDDNALGFRRHRLRFFFDGGGALHLLSGR